MIPTLCLLADTISYTDLCEQPDKRPCYRILKIKDHKHILPWGQFDKYHKHVLLWESSGSSKVLLHGAGNIQWYGTTSVPPPHSCFVIGVGGVRVPWKVGCPQVIGVSELGWMIITNPLLANKKSAKDFIRTLCETWSVHQRLCSVCGPIALYAEQWVRLGTGDRCLSLPCVNQERPWLTHRFWIHIHLFHFLIF